MAVYVLDKIMELSSGKLDSAFCQLIKETLQEWVYEQFADQADF